MKLQEKMPEQIFAARLYSYPYSYPREQSLSFSLAPPQHSYGSEFSLNHINRGILVSEKICRQGRAVASRPACWPAHPQPYFATLCVRALWPPR